MSTEEQRKKRLQEISTYLEAFQQAEKIRGVEVIYRQDAMEIINSIYWRYADDLIRKTIDSGIIQNYKIVANTELAIMLAAPIENIEGEYKDTSDFEVQKLFTARLAFYTAFSMLIEWNKIPFTECHTLVEQDAEISAFLDEHIKWLYLLDPTYYYPVFSNMQVWRLFYLLLETKIANLKG